MNEMIQTPGPILIVTIFVVVALGTVAMALMVEGIRRWFRSRAVTRALQKIHRPEGAPGSEPARATQSSLLTEGEFAGPAWLEAIVIRLPHREDLQRLLDQAGVRNFGAASVLIVAVGLAVIFGLITVVAFTNVPISIAAAAVGAYLPFAFLRIRRTKRFAAFEENFPDSIDLLARSARAGHAFAAGLKVVADEAVEPEATEFRQVYEEQRFGLPMQDSLMGLADRVDIVDVRIFVTSVLIQRESGGNLAENLDGLSEVIRGRFRFKRDVKTKTAHGRITGTVVALAPVVLGVGLYLIDPEYMSPMITEPLGRMMLAVGTGMMLVGFFVIRRLVDIKV